MPRAERLGGVFENVHAIFFAERNDRFHLRALSKEKDGNDRLDALCLFEGIFKRGNGKIECGRIDIDKAGPRAESGDATSRGEEGVRGGEDRVPRRNAK